MSRWGGKGLPGNVGDEVLGLALKLRESFESQGNEGASFVRGRGSHMESEDVLS